MMVDRRTYIFIIFIIKILDCSGSKTFLRIYRFDVCECNEDCVIKNYVYSLRHPERHNTLMSSKFTLTKDIHNLMLRVDPMKCKTQDTLDSCEKVSKVRTNNACGIMKLKKTMWSDFTESFTPQFKCPLLKGLYISENSTFDADLYNVLPLGGQYFRTRINFFNTTKHNFLWTFCLDFGVIDLH